MSNIVYNVNHQIQITCEGVGKIIASGNASPNGYGKFRVIDSFAFQGAAMAIIRTGYESGKSTLKEGYIRRY